VPPAAKVTATSSTDASKLNDANCSTRTPGPAPSTGPSPATRFTGPPCGTATGFGVPADPDVKITYASWSPASATGAVTGGIAAIAAATCGSARSTTVVPAAASAAASAAGRAPRASTSPAWLAASMDPSRCTGQSGSSGRYAAPASHTPTIAVIMSGPRSRHSPTTCSGPAPACRRYPASRAARTASSP